MATKTSLLGLTKPAYTEAADIAVLNTNFDLIDKAVGNRTRVPNLLVNSWFVNPINYQGRTGTYEGVANYTTFVLDQWKTWSTGCSYTIASTGLQITNKNTSSTAGPWEVLQNPARMKGKTYTLAVGYGGGNVVCGSATVPSGSVTADKYVAAVNATGATPGLRLVIYAKDQRVEFQIMVAAGQTVTVEWAALYEGVYDAETLPEYMVPDKRTEMVRCDVPLNPQNLLVNSWFVNPVNQRGQTVYTGSNFTIDFWRTWNAAATITLTGSGIKGDGTDASVLYQDLDVNTIKPNTAYTVAAGYSDGTIECQSSVITESNNIGIWNGESQVFLAYNAGASFVRLWNKTKTIQWMAVYQGAYDADTLPEYVVPDKRVEMIRCGIPLNPPNLLDNSYFRAGSAIAQAGVNGTHGSTKYPLDRWISWDKDITQSNNYITIGSPIDQYVESYKIDPSAVYTAAVGFADGTQQVVFGNFTTGFGSKATGCLYCGTASSGKPFVRMQTGFNICWVALYEGAYDADTLPEYHYKGYAAELAECQRYYIKIATQPINGWCYNWGRVAAFVSLPVKMRVSCPTVVLARETPNFYVNATAYNAALEGSTSVENGVVIYYKHTAAINGQCVIPEFAAEINADL